MKKGEVRSHLYYFIAIPALTAVNIPTTFICYPKMSKICLAVYVGRLYKKLYHVT